MAGQLGKQAGVWVGRGKWLHDCGCDATGSTAPNRSRYGTCSPGIWLCCYTAVHTLWLPWTREHFMALSWWYLLKRKWTETDHCCAVGCGMLWPVQLWRGGAPAWYSKKGHLRAVQDKGHVAHHGAICGHVVPSCLEVGWLRSRAYAEIAQIKMTTKVW